MRVAFDIDGTVDSDPAVFGSLMAALKAAGHVVVILTGSSEKHPDENELDAKRNYLNELGLGHCWDELVVFASPPHKAKAKWIKKNHVDLMIDNSQVNAELAAKYTTVLVPWNTRTGGKEH